jgi:4-amino-4-deoxy-L-arabinose transferase-like glycosyltransferase
VILSSRVGYALAVVLLLMGAALRMWHLSTLPAGLHDNEITDIRITEGIRQGSIEVFYDLGGEGRESLYHMLLAAVTGVIGNGTVGYTALSLWAGMLLLAAVYALATRLFSPAVGVAALGLLSTNLWAIFLSREISRQALLPGLVAIMLLTLARAFSVYRERHPSLPENTIFAVLGVLLGLGFYLHPSHFMIVLFSMAFIAYWLLSRRRLPQQTFGYLLFSLLVFIIIGMPYLLSTVRLPDLSGAARIVHGYNVNQNPPLEAIFSSIGGILFQGDSSPIHNLPGRPLIDLLSGLIMLIGILTTARRWREPRFTLIAFATIALVPVAFLSGRTPDFLALTPLLPLIAIFFGLGLATLHRSVDPRLRLVIRLGAGILLIFNLIWTGRDVFQVWPALPAVADGYHSRAGHLAAYLDRTAATIPTVLCESDWHFHKDDALSGTDLILLMMNRKDVHLRYADCGTGMIFIDGGERQQIIMPDPNTLANMQPYLRGWIDQGVQPTNVPSDSVVEIHVAQQLADTVGRFTTMSPAGYAPESPGGSGLAVPPVRFGGNIAFLGYEPLNSGLYPPGGVVTTITYWRVDGAVPPDLRLFTHILSDPVAIAAQNDTISVDVSQLGLRDVFIQITFVPLPPQTPPGMYQISVGAYTAANDERLPVMDSDTAQPRGNRLFLGQITVGQA